MQNHWNLKNRLNRLKNVKPRTQYSLLKGIALKNSSTSMKSLRRPVEKFSMEMFHVPRVFAYKEEIIRIRVSQLLVIIVL